METKMELKDICLNCGSEHESKRWGASCSCGNPNVVHQLPCNGCGRIVGYLIDDDYCGPDKLYCATCMDKGRNSNLLTMTMSVGLQRRIEKGLGYLPDYMLNDDGSVKDGDWF